MISRTTFKLHPKKGLLLGSLARKRRDHNITISIDIASGGPVEFGIHIPESVRVRCRIDVHEER